MNNPKEIRVLLFSGKLALYAFGFRGWRNAGGCVGGVAREEETVDIR